MRETDSRTKQHNPLLLGEVRSRRTLSSCAILVLMSSCSCRKRDVYVTTPSTPSNTLYYFPHSPPISPPLTPFSTLSSESINEPPPNIIPPASPTRVQGLSLCLRCHD